MPILAQWRPFSGGVIEIDKDNPGVYELGDKSGMVVYVGSSNELRRRLKEHLNESTYTCIKQNTTQYRLEYTQDYKKREQELYDAHIAAYDKPPKCNDARPSGY